MDVESRKNPTLRDLSEASVGSEAGISVERIGDRVIIRLEQPFAYVEVRGRRYHVADIY